jgi:hypothetical protein
VRQGSIPFVLVVIIVVAIESMMKGETDTNRARHPSFTAPDKHPAAGSGKVRRSFEEVF